MNQRLHIHRLAGGLLGAAGLLVALWAPREVYGAETNAPVAKAAIVIPQSVFLDDLTKGKDPFFPGTTRRIDKVAVAAAEAANAAATPAKPKVEQVQLKGILDSPNRRLALINNRAFAVGERAEVKTAAGGKLQLQCVEIRSSSVIVLFAGETQRRELHLHEKL